MIFFPCYFDFLRALHSYSSSFIRLKYINLNSGIDLLYTYRWLIHESVLYIYCMYLNDGFLEMEGNLEII